MNQTGNATADETAARAEIGILQDTLCLKLNQAETLYDLMRLTAPGAVERVCHSFNETGVVLREVRKVKSGQKCEMGHSILFAYDLVCSSGFSPKGEEVHTLGSVCASHVLNLPAPVARCIEGLSRWTRRLESKEYPEMIARYLDRYRKSGVKDSEAGQRMIDEYRQSAEYAEVMAALPKIKGRETDAAQAAKTQRRQLFNVARLCHAIRTVEVCEAGELPLTRTVVLRIKRAVTRLAVVDRQRQAASVASTSTTTSPSSTPTPIAQPHINTPMAPTVSGGSMGITPLLLGL